MTTTTNKVTSSVARESEKSVLHGASYGYGMAALSGILLVLAFPNADQGWLAWLGLAPWLTAFPQRRLRDVLGQSALFGIIFYGGLLGWLAQFAAHAIGPALGAAAWAIATLAQTSVMLIFGAGLHLLSRRWGRWQWYVGIAALWTLLEWVRQLGSLGTGWGDLAYSQYRYLTILQTTKVTGVWGLSFLIAVTAAAVAGYLRGNRLGLKIAAPLLAMAFVYGGVARNTEHLRPSFGAAALQTKIDPNVSWSGARAGSPAYVQDVMRSYTAQTDEAAASGAKVVLWPETAFPGYLRDDPELAQTVIDTARRDNLAILVGSNERMPGVGADANSVIVVTPDGKIGNSYAKRQLVPFGEFVPGRKWLGFLNALHLTIYDRASGAARQPLVDAGSPVGKVAVAVCYESSYSRLTQEQVARGANILAVASDDAWFGKTAAGPQHAAIACVRAAESDRYLIRAAPTGISRIIAADGRVLAEGGLETEKIVLAKVESRNTMPPFNRFGDWFVALSGGLAFISLLTGLRR